MLRLLEFQWFAINKIDRETANSDKIKEQLSSINILLEDWEEVNFSPKRFQQKQDKE